MKNFWGIIFIMSILMSDISAQDSNNSNILLQVDKDFAELSVKAGAKKAFETYLLDNAISLSDDHNPIFGLAKISDSFGNFDDKLILKWEPQFAEVSECNKMGWTWGIFYTLNKKTKEVLKKGKYLNVWKRDKDNNWKVKVDMGNSSPME